MTFAKRIHEDRLGCRFLQEKHLAISNWHLAQLKPAPRKTGERGFVWANWQMVNCQVPGLRPGTDRSSEASFLFWHLPDIFLKFSPDFRSRLTHYY
jgi:hypothetical protein